LCTNWQTKLVHNGIWQTNDMDLPISNFLYKTWENVFWCVPTFLVRLSLNKQANEKEMNHSNCCYPNSCNEHLYPHSNLEDKPRLDDICTCWRTKIEILKTNQLFSKLCKRHKILKKEVNEFIINHMCTNLI